MPNTNITPLGLQEQDPNLVGWLHVEAGGTVYRRTYETASWYSLVRIPEGDYPVIARKRQNYGEAVELIVRATGTVEKEYTPASFGGYGGNIRQDPQGTQHRHVGNASEVFLYVGRSGDRTAFKCNYGYVSIDPWKLYVERVYFTYTVKGESYTAETERLVRGDARERVLEAGEFLVDAHVERVPTIGQRSGEVVRDKLFTLVKVGWVERLATELGTSEDPR